MPAADLVPRGPFSLSSSIRFLEGFTPASYGGSGDGTLRLAFPADDGSSVIGCAVRQDGGGGGPAPVHVEFTLPPGGTAPRAGAARSQVARILSLDVDGTDFPALGERDAVVASLQADYPGLRPVCFHSPYEAAVWAIIGHRIRRTQAAALKSRLAREHGQAVEVAGERLHAFPAPQVLRGLTGLPGLTGVKVERLHAVAEAAMDGRLDADALRAQPADRALRALCELPGIGPFSAELILIRGAGHPDVFPVAEPRVHRSLAAEYRLGEGAADPARLARIAEAWRPFRSWVAVLLRVRAQERALAG